MHRLMGGLHVPFGPDREFSCPAHFVRCVYELGAILGMEFMTLVGWGYRLSAVSYPRGPRCYVNGRRNYHKK